MSDPFDNPEDLRCQPSPETVQRRQQREKKHKLIFARIPYVLGMKAAANCPSPLLATLLALWYLRFTRHKNPVEFSNTHLKELGMSRRGKYRALQTLENAGLIRVAYRGKKSPLVTLLWSE
jgi:hypothetical protein